MPDLFRKATLVQKYTLMKYLMQAYERVLNKYTSNKTCAKQKPSLSAPHSPIKNKTKNLQKTGTNYSTLSPVFRAQINDLQQEVVFEVPPEPAQSSETNDNVIDLLSIFQQDANTTANEQNSVTVEPDIELDFEQNIILPPPPSRAPVVNISDLLRTNSLDNSNDIEFSFAIQQQPPKPHFMEDTPKQQTLLSSSSAQPTEVRQSARLVAQNRTVSYEGQQAAASGPQISNRSADITPPRTSQRRFKPHTIITEEEYSLRFRLPCRKFLEITSLPQVKYNIDTSSIAFFGMDMSLIEEEYFRNVDAISEVQLSNAALPTLTISSALATITSDNLSSVNVVRQAASSLMELSSFGRPLLPIATTDVSRIAEELSSHQAISINDELPPKHVANISIDSIVPNGVAANAGY